MENLNREKFEQIDKDITHVTTTARKKTEGNIIGLERSRQKRKL